MRIRKIIQSASAGLVLGAEAIGAIVLHESGNLAITAPAVIVVIFLTIWGLDVGLDLAIKSWDWAANWFGVKPGSKVKIHGYWYSSIRDQSGKLLGGSVFLIKAGMNDVDFQGTSMDLDATGDPWTWWSGEGAPFSSDAILYGYRGEEGGSGDDGFGMYSFPPDSPDVVWGSFYGKKLPEDEKYRTANGRRVPKADLTPEFLEDKEVRKQALTRYLEAQPAAVAAS